MEGFHCLAARKKPTSPVVDVVGFCFLPDGCHGCNKHMYNRILVPLDGSETAEGVLPHAKALAFSEGAEIILLRVAVNPALEFSFSDPAVAESAVRDLELQSRAYLAEIEKALESDGFQVKKVIGSGAVAETILRTSEEYDVDAIVMSTHGRTGPARWLLGSVADRVVRSSSIPVLLIRAQG